MFRRLLISLSIIIFLGFGNIINAQQENVDSERFVYESTRVGTFADGVFVYKNDNTSVSGKFLEGTTVGCGLCTAGDTLYLNTSFMASPISAGHPGLVNGRLYKNVYFSGWIVFHGGEYTLPYRWTRGRFSVTFPATLTSLLNFHTEGFNYQNPTTPFYTKQLSLQGTVTATLEMIRIVPNPNGKGVTPYFRLHEIKYDFSNNSQQITEDSATIFQ